METLEKVRIASPEKVAAFLKKGKEDLNKVKNYLQIDGDTYLLGEWVTLKKYCLMFEIENIETVLNWINRGIVPKENVKVLEDLNGLRLIKAMKYK